ncbi:MAG TPA: hypothetical protein VKT70_03305 [Stellaceae bacterium]|nr:hypothetical protein [Stellaceae bacterium]
MMIMRLTLAGATALLLAAAAPADQQRVALLHEAREVAGAVAPEQRFPALLRIAEGELDLGDEADAKATLVLANAALAAAANPPSFADGRGFVGLLTRAGDLPGALKVVDSVTDPGRHLIMLSAIAEAQAAHGQKDALRDSLALMDQAGEAEGAHDSGFGLVARAASDAGDAETALLVAERITRKGLNLTVTARILEAKARRGDRAQVPERLDPLKAELASVPERERGFPTVALAAAYEASGRIEVAKELVRQSLPAADAPRAADEPVLILARGEAWAEAREVAEHAPPLARPDALFALAQMALSAGRKEEARAELREAASAESGRNVAGANGQPPLLRILAAQIEAEDTEGALAAVGKVAAEERGDYLIGILTAETLRGREGAASLIKLVEQILPKLKNPRERIEALVRSAVAQATLGDAEAAHQGFARARREAGKGESTDLALIASGQAEAHDLEGALATLHEIKNPGDPGQLLALVIDAAAEAGDTGPASREVEHLPPERRDPTLARIAHAEASQGQFDEALKNARFIADPGTRLAIMIALSRSANPQ